MKSLLIFPPALRPSRPYLSVPLLIGQLKNSGFEAIGLDWNVEFYNDIYTREYILKTKAILENIAQITDYHNKPEYFLQKQTIIKKCLAENTEEILMYIDSAVQVFKNEKYFYNQGILSKAIHIINKTNAFLALPYYPVKCTSDPIKYPFKLNYSEIKNYCFNKEENIFIEYFDQKIDKIIDKNTDLIGISVPFDNCIPTALTLARLLKEKTNAHITIGGQAFTYNQASVLKYPEIFDIFCDSMLIGPGEHSIVELAGCLKNKTGFDNVSGLIYKTDNIKINPPKTISTMDNIANVDLDSCDFNKYFTPDIIMPVLFSKGCPWGKCLFCTFTYTRQAYCAKKPHQIVDELEELVKKYKLKFFRFHDDCITPAFYSNLSDEIIKRRLDIRYCSFARLDNGFTKELLKKMYKSGLRHVFWGLESGSEKILKLMNKGIDVKCASKILKDSHDAGINNHLSTIIAFPPESQEDFQKTYDFCNDNREYIDSYGTSKFQLYSCNVMCEMQEQFEIKTTHEEEFSFSKEYENFNISEDEINRRVKLFYDSFPCIEIDLLYILKYGQKWKKIRSIFGLEA